MNAQPFRLGLIGGGRMGRTHMRALAASTEVQIVAVVEPSADGATSLRHEGMTVFPTLAEMIATMAVDGVLIAVPTPQHITTTRAALDAGLPVLCEKPFGLQPDAAREVGRFAADTGLALQIAYWRRFVPQLRALRADIAAGRYGTVHLLACSQWDEAPPAAAFRQHSGGIYVDMGVHEIDQIRWVLGHEIVQSWTHSHPHTANPDAHGDVDSAHALAVLSNGAAATISLGRYHLGGDLVSVQLLGSKDHTKFDVVSPTTGEQPQLDALRTQAESFARHVHGAPPHGACADDAASILELAQQLSTPTDSHSASA